MYKLVQILVFIGFLFICYLLYKLHRHIEIVVKQNEKIPNKWKKCIIYTTIILFVAIVIALDLGRSNFRKVYVDNTGTYHYYKDCEELDYSNSEDMFKFQAKYKGCIECEECEIEDEFNDERREDLSTGRP